MGSFFFKGSQYKEGYNKSGEYDSSVIRAIKNSFRKHGINPLIGFAMSLEESTGGKEDARNPLQEKQRFYLDIAKKQAPVLGNMEAMVDASAQHLADNIRLKKGNVAQGIMHYRAGYKGSLQKEAQDYVGSINRTINDLATFPENKQLLEFLRR